MVLMKRSLISRKVGQLTTFGNYIILQSNTIFPKPLSCVKTAAKSGNFELLREEGRQRRVSGVSFFNVVELSPKFIKCRNHYPTFVANTVGYGGGIRFRWRRIA